MRIAIDVMGGDHAPGAILDGAFAALKSRDSSDELLLVGKGDIIRQAMASQSVTDPRVRIVDAVDEIGMDEQPVEAVRSKPQSSLVVMAELAHRRVENAADVILSAGNTGACVCAAQMSQRRLPGVHRPGIAVILPTFGGPVVLCDVGANPDPRPSHLAQYGLMGEVYAREMLGIASPRVAMMNIGGEEGKGTGLIKSTRDLLKATPDLNYVGFVEGRSLFDHAADVVVTDGFVGNVVIKLAEGLASGLFRTIAREIAAIDPELAGHLGHSPERSTQRSHSSSGSKFPVILPSLAPSKPAQNYITPAAGAKSYQNAASWSKCPSPSALIPRWA